MSDNTQLSQAEIDFNNWLQENHDWLMQNQPEMERALWQQKFVKFMSSCPRYNTPIRIVHIIN